jgi:hypothetical protein
LDRRLPASFAPDNPENTFSRSRQLASVHGLQFFQHASLVFCAAKMVPINLDIESGIRVKSKAWVASPGTVLAMSGDPDCKSWWRETLQSVPENRV